MFLSYSLKSNQDSHCLDQKLPDRDLNSLKTTLKEQEKLNENGKFTFSFHMLLLIRQETMSLFETTVHWCIHTYTKK